MNNDQPTEITPEGDKIWRNAAGKPHRDGAPAVIFANGDRYWYQNGELHREDGPACEFFSGSKEWYLHGGHHREDGTAIDHADRHKEWRQNGLLHREDGPAIDANGCKSWYREGELHREDGPAMMLANGDKYWYQNDKLHRADGPAIEEYSSGNRLWYLNGLIHREDGPASELPDEGKFWYRNGVLHREDGPAIERKDGRREYWINGERIEPPIAPAQQRAVILAALVKNGWVPYDLNGGIAAKAFSTEDGCVIAHAYLSPEGDGFNRVLSGSHLSEGRDVLLSAGALVPISAPATDCSAITDCIAIAESFSRNVDSIMECTLRAKLLRSALIGHVVRCNDAGWSFVYQKPGADEFRAAVLKATDNHSASDIQNSLHTILDIGEKYVNDHLDSVLISNHAKSVFAKARNYLSTIEPLQEKGKLEFDRLYCHHDHRSMVEPSGRIFKPGM